MSFSLRFNPHHAFPGSRAHIVSLSVVFSNISSSHEEGGTTKPTECFFSYHFRGIWISNIYYCKYIIAYFVVLCVFSLNRRQLFSVVKIGFVKTDVAVCDFFLIRFIS